MAEIKIKIISGTYGKLETQEWKDEDGNAKATTKIMPKTSKDDAFELDPEEAKRLVGLGVAVYADGDAEEEDRDGDGEGTKPEAGKPSYSADTNANVLRDLMKSASLTIKVGMSKAEMAAALDEHYGAANAADDREEDGDADGDADDSSGIETDESEGGGDGEPPPDLSAQEPVA